MPINRLKATISERGTHPDLAEDGSARADPWDRQFAEDEVYRGTFMDAVTAEQSALPTHVQRLIQGQTYGAGRPVSEGLKEYSDSVKALLYGEQLMLRGEWNRLSPERQDELAAEGWRVHDPFNREGRIDLKLAEQWSDSTTVSEYNAAVARANRARQGGF